MKLRYIFILGLTLLLGCTHDPPKPNHLITEDTYINLLVELQLVSSLGESQQADSLEVDSLTTEVFNRYEVSSDQFWDSHQYYQQFPTQQKLRVDQAIEHLQMDQISNTSEDSTSDQ